MADPLTIATSIAGLLTLTGSIHQALSSFIEKFEHAPKSARTILMEVSITREALSAMSSLIEKFLQVPRERRAMVRLDLITLTVSHAVMAFSDLELLLSRWPELSKIPISFGTRLRWARQDDKASQLVRRLQEARFSLSLVLNIFQRYALCPIPFFSSFFHSFFQ
jgi:hypothetical protein